MKCCAICADGPTATVMRPLGRDDAMVPVCLECDTGPIVAKTGPDRSYEPTGGTLTLEETIAGEKRLYGEDEYRRIAAQASRDGQRPVPAKSTADRIADDHVFETIRRWKTKAADYVGKRRSSRERKLY